MPDKNVRISIPDKVRAQLWVAAGGRCEFNCCNKRLDRNVLTRQDLFLGQHAHIIGDSPNGPRGNEALSKKLAHDPANLMLLCAPCHTTIDRLAGDYDADLLHRMKQRHEDRIQRLYDIDETKDSVAIVLRHPIKGIHAPQFSDRDVQAAILTNSDFCHAPSEHVVQLDYRKRAAREGDQAYWQELVKELKHDFESQMHLASLKGQTGPAHLSVFAFAPMPLNMQLGALIGNKVEASTFQWDRTAESWKFRAQRQLERQGISFDNIPPAEGRDLAVAMSLSGEVKPAAVRQAVNDANFVRFGVPNPSPALVEDADDVRHFRSRFTAFMAEVRNQGYARMHVFPAMPLSLSIELGRQLLPHADPAIGVWDLQDRRFVPTLQIQF